MYRVLTPVSRGGSSHGIRGADRGVESPRRPRLKACLGLGVMLLSLWQPAPSAAQETDCRLVKVGGQTRSMRSVFSSGPVAYRHYASGGVDYRCTDGTRVFADSAIVYESDNQVQLYGSVFFQDAETELQADSAFYFSNLRRLHAWSGVKVTDRIGGAVIQGEFLTYDQASEFRALDRITVDGGQPHATFPVARVQADPPDPDSGQVQADPPEPDSGQAQAAPSDPEAGQESAPPAEEVAEAEAADTVPSTPWEIDAVEFFLEGRRHFRAFGNVEIVRDSLQAFGDTLNYDQEVGDMVVTGGARFEGQGYTLTGASISVTPTGPVTEEVLARENARLTGDEVDMTAPAILLFVDNGNVDRLVALASAPAMPGADDELDTSGLSPGDAERARALSETQAPAREGEAEAAEDPLPRPRVTAEGFLLNGDSIEVLSPNQRLDQVVAVGDARAEAIEQDTLRAAGLPEVAQRDWLTGDRIVAQFGPDESSDSTGAPERAPGDTIRHLETLTATGSARSFYRMFPSDTAEVGTDPRPALHLVSGNEITIHLEGQQVVRTEIEGQTEGWHFDPLPATADTATADTAAAATDTTSSGRVQPPGAGAPAFPRAAQPVRRRREQP